ncbi:MAG: hypothetical protein ABW098_17075 [Candidatus Thiodiazotropha sp.]
MSGISACEIEILETERRCDPLKKKDTNLLHSVVPGSRLYEIINNPLNEGIDEG